MPGNGSRPEIKEGDGTEVGDIAGESSDFTSAVRGLCKSKWPKLWKEMDL